MSDDLTAVEIYIAADPLAAHRLRLELMSHGIRAHVVGDLLGGASGDLPLGIAAAPAVWVSSDVASRAREIALDWEATERSRASRPEPARVICPHCGESIPDDHDACPFCGPQPAQEPASPSAGPRASASDFTPMFENRRLAVVVALLLLPVAAFLGWLMWRAPPRTTEGLYYRAWDRYDAGNYHGAIDDFEQCLFGNSYDVGPYTGIAASHYMLGNLELALKNYSRALRCDPTISENYLQRGVCQYFLGRDALAAADYRLRLVEAPDEFWTLNNLAWLLAASPDDTVRNPVEALTLARRAEQLAAADRQYAQSTLAAALAANGDYEAASELIAPLLPDAGEDDRRLWLAMQSAFSAGQAYIDAVDQRRFDPVATVTE